MRSKKENVKLFQHTIIRLIFLLVGIVVIIGLFRSVVDLWQKRGIVNEREAELRQLQEEQSALIAQLEEATSSAFVEKVAREKLGLVKEGEIVVIMDKTETGDRRQETGEQDLPNWKQWWRLFF